MGYSFKDLNMRPFGMRFIVIIIQVDNEGRKHQPNSISESVSIAAHPRDILVGDFASFYATEP
jgi:hypothetical protein